jgi:hypothetical protein
VQRGRNRNVAPDGSGAVAHKTEQFPQTGIALEVLHKAVPLVVEKTALSRELTEAVERRTECFFCVLKQPDGYGAFLDEFSSTK